MSALLQSRITCGKGKEKERYIENIFKIVLEGEKLLRWRRLEDMPWRRLEDVSWRRLERHYGDKQNTYWGYLHT